MKKLPTALLTAAAMMMFVGTASAQDDGDRPRDGQRDGDRPRRPRDGDRPRGPGEGERPRGPRDADSPRGPRDGQRPPGPGDRRPEGQFGGGHPLLMLLDTDRNGTLSSEEIDQAIVALRKLDRNGDGSLTRDEMGSVVFRGPGGQAFGPGEGRPGFGRPGEGRPGFGRPGEGRPGEGRPGPGRPGADGAGQRPGPDQMLARFMQADKNGDKKLSKDEVPGRMKDGFDRIDTDGSGFLEQSELEAMVKRFSGGREGRDGADRPDRGNRGGERKRPAIEE